MRGTQKIFELMQNIDAILVVSEKNRRYFTEFNSTFGILLLFPQKSCFITDSRYAEMAQSEISSDVEILVCTGSQNANELVLKLLLDNGVKHLGFEDNQLTVSEYEKFRSIFSNVEFVPVGSSIDFIRRTKSDDEIALITQAQEITDKAFSEIVKIVKAGVSEREVAYELEYIINKLGGDGLAFSTIVASGINTSKPHAHPTDKKIESGDAVTIDFGAAYKGYCSDMTRTIFVGEPNAEILKIYNTVLAAQQSAIANARCGITGKELDSFAREIIIANGFGEFFTHGTGHSLGIDIHEEPRASFTCNEIFTANAFVTVEPGIYIPSFGGVRIEDLLLIKETEVINLTTSDKNVIIL